MNVDNSFIFLTEFMFPNSFIYDSGIFSHSWFLSQSMNKNMAYPNNKEPIKRRLGHVTWIGLDTHFTQDDYVSHKSGDPNRQKGVL